MDESTFSLQGADGRKRVETSEFEDGRCMHHDRFGGGDSVMVSGGISAYYRTDIMNNNVNLQKYRNQLIHAGLFRHC